jgi:hypothetical protein
MMLPSAAALSSIVELIHSDAPLYHTIPVHLEVDPTDIYVGAGSVVEFAAIEGTGDTGIRVMAHWLLSAGYSGSNVEGLLKMAHQRDMVELKARIGERLRNGLKGMENGWKFALACKYNMPGLVVCLVISG